jgi:hypothetical protein
MRFQAVFGNQIEIIFIGGGRGLIKSPLFIVQIINIREFSLSHTKL